MRKIGAFAGYSANKISWPCLYIIANSQLWLASNQVSGRANGQTVYMQFQAGRILDAGGRVTSSTLVLKDRELIFSAYITNKKGPPKFNCGLASPLTKLTLTALYVSRL